MTFFRLYAALLAVLSAPVQAHEFWISPLDYQPAAGDSVAAHFRNGEEFQGGTYAYFPQRSRRFEMLAGGKVFELTPRPGDKPAFTLPPDTPEGLLVVVHETAPSTLTYRNWDKFLAFAAHKDFPNAAADHDAAGWPRDKFRESYTRHVKTLIAYGSGEGTDQFMGMETEFVSQTNPYDVNIPGTVNFKLLYAEKPRENAQVEVFIKDPVGDVKVELYHTNDQGNVEISVLPGHEYLLDAVVLRPAENPDADPDKPLWETLWAALTFKVPAR